MLLSFYLSICLSISLSLSISQPLNLSLNQSVNQSINQSLSQSVSQSINQSINPPINWSICLSCPVPSRPVPSRPVLSCLSVCLVCVSNYLSLHSFKHVCLTKHTRNTLRSFKNVGDGCTNIVHIQHMYTHVTWIYTIKSLDMLFSCPASCGSQFGQSSVKVLGSAHALACALTAKGPNWNRGPEGRIMYTVYPVQRSEPNVSTICLYILYDSTYIIHIRIFCKHPVYKIQLIDEPRDVLRDVLHLRSQIWM